MLKSHDTSISTVDATFCLYDKPGIVGGTSTWIRRLVPELNRLGVSSSCLCFLHTGAIGPTVSELRDHGVVCHLYHGDATTEHRVAWILATLQRNPCRVFIPNEVPAAYHAIPWLRHEGVPTIGVMHSDSAPAHKMRSIFASDDMDRALDAVVCVSETIEYSVRRSSHPFTSVVRIPCGVPIPAHSVERHATPFRIVYLGRFSQEKRIVDVVRGFCRVVDEIPQTEALIIGDGPERDAVDNIVSTHGAGLPVQVTGYVDPDEIQSILIDCHAIVLLSDYEGLPVSLMEGMASGCVPVCYRIPSGIPELVDHEKTGILIDDRSDALVAAIRDLVADRSHWERLSQAARARVASSYADEACVKRWVGLIRQYSTDSPTTKRLQPPKHIRVPLPQPPFDYPSDRYHRPVSVRVLLSIVRDSLVKTGRQIGRK